jgi:hypothetical protein
MRFTSSALYFARRELSFRIANSSGASFLFLTLFRLPLRGCLFFRTGIDFPVTVADMMCMHIPLLEFYPTQDIDCWSNIMFLYVWRNSDDISDSISRREMRTHVSFRVVWPKQETESLLHVLLLLQACERITSVGVKKRRVPQWIFLFLLLHPLCHVFNKNRVRLILSCSDRRDSCRHE